MFKPFSFNTKYKQSYHKIATSEINHYNIKELDMHFFDRSSLQPNNFLNIKKKMVHVPVIKLQLINTFCNS